MSGSNTSNPADANAAVEPLSLTVHDVATPTLPSARRGRITMFLVLLACASPVLLSYFMYYVARPQARNNYAELILPSRGLPADLALTDLTGKPVTSGSLKGQWLLIVVAGGGCAAPCETHLYQQRQLREMMGKERDRLDKLWLVPDAQSLPSAVQAAVSAQPSAQVLRVSREALAAWLQPEEGRSLEDHLYLVDPMGEWMMRTPVDMDPMKFKKDLERLLRASAFWDRPGRGD